MQILKNQILMLLLLYLFCASCGDDCKTTYRPETGIGFVFMYDTTNNISYPVEGAKITVYSSYLKFGLMQKDIRLATETYTTNAEGKYQVRFLEKGCSNGMATECNYYKFICNNKDHFGFLKKTLDIFAIDNIYYMSDTIKLYK